MDDINKRSEVFEQLTVDFPCEVGKVTNKHLETIIDNKQA